MEKCAKSPNNPHPPPDRVMEGATVRFIWRLRHRVSTVHARAWPGILLMVQALIITTNSPVQAQTCPADQYCYYVPATLPFIGDRDLFTTDRRQLVMSSYSGNAQVAYTLGTSATVVNQTVRDDEEFEVDLSVQATAFGFAESQGAYVVSNKPLFVVVRGVGFARWASQIRESRVALGTRFRVAGFSLNGLVREGVLFRTTVVEGADALSVYAPEGGVLTLTAPPGITDIWENQSGPVHTVTLLPGQTYTVRTSGDVCDAELNGALVESTAPIAVMSGGRGAPRASCGLDGRCQDVGLDNVMPVREWGTEYVLFQHRSTSQGGEDVRVVADVANTIVRINGVEVGTIAEPGRAYTFKMNEGGSPVVVLTSSAPVGVFQNAGGRGCQMDHMFVSPFSLSSSETRLSVPFHAQPGDASVGAPRHYGTLLTARSRLGDIDLDGNGLQDEVAGTTLLDVPTRDDLVVVQFPVADNDHRLTSSGDFLFTLAVVQDGVFSPVDGGSLVAYHPTRPGPGECVSNFECPDGDACEGGLCVTPCDSSNECDTDEVCTDGYCTPACTTTEDCDGARVCRDGVCVVPPPCDGSDDCVDGEECLDGVCVPRSSECTATSDCAAPEVCVGGACVAPSACTGASDCDASELCDQGACVPRCTSDLDCHEGEQCGQGGACGNPCGDGTDCPDGWLCSTHGTCVDCLRDSDCDGRDVCGATGQCTAPCEDDADCGGALPVCLSDGTCGECADATQCEVGEVCVASSCQVPCGDDSECSGGTPVCSAAESPMICVECTEDSQCPEGQRCSRSNVCVDDGEVPDDGTLTGSGTCTAAPVGRDTPPPLGLLLLCALAAALRPRRR